MGPGPGDDAMPTIGSLDELAALVESAPPEWELYLRWSRGPQADLADGQAEQSSRDSLTGVTLPGLSANPLRIEPWWGHRSRRLWVARRLYDYRHLRDLRGEMVRPWILRGTERGRGPDNEPLVICHEPIAWVSDKALQECEEAIDEQQSDEWGPLNRAD